MEFCLLVTVALYIFIKEKKILLSFLDFSFVISLCKRCLLGQSKWKGTLLTIFRPPLDIPTPPTYYVLHKFPTPCLIEPPVYSGP